MSDEIRYRFIEDGDFIVFEDGRVFKKLDPPVSSLDPPVSSSGYKFVRVGKKSYPLHRAFFDLERKEPTYTSIRVIQENPDDMERLFRVAMSELAAFQKKYASVRRLQTVFDAIGQLPMEEPDIQHKEDKE